MVNKSMEKQNKQTKNPKKNYQREPKLKQQRKGDNIPPNFCCLRVLSPKI